MKTTRTTRVKGKLGWLALLLGGYFITPWAAASQDHEHDNPAYQNAVTLQDYCDTAWSLSEASATCHGQYRPHSVAAHGVLCKVKTGCLTDRGRWAVQEFIGVYLQIEDLRNCSGQLQLSC